MYRPGPPSYIGDPGRSRVARRVSIPGAPAGDPSPARRDVTTTRVNRMIVRSKTAWIRLLFSRHGSMLKYIATPLALNLLLALAAVYGEYKDPGFFKELSPIPFSLLGVALAIFVAFRNNVCYARFWEARILWGNMKNTARDLARFFITAPGLSMDDPQVVRAIDLLAAFPYALKHQLRGTDPRANITRLLDRSLAADVLRRECRAQYVLELLQRRLVDWHREGRYGEVLLAAGLQKLGVLSGVLGGCERIRGTPVPYAYDVLLHRTTHVYCAVLPFGLAGSLGWATPFIASFITYAYLAWHAIATELEEPFGVEPNDLALAAMSVDTERALRQAIDAADMPPRLAPDRRFRLY
ncbi:hypothetical protein CAL29_15960 [Bordetella genomosp. 10]|uniref:Bestrophin n=1 Tax=Bordetella genomosp. 10 TaxID=1416804 RepID=A0A261SC28_9BORD|nr:bestrophin family ion channel [Bordetella genomosp. 10]OZI34944.1 hypothetical protein CAL29_15960 [Bordetella genomosp. 10]